MMNRTIAPFLLGIVYLLFACQPSVDFPAQTQSTVVVEQVSTSVMNPFPTRQSPSSSTPSKPTFTPPPRTPSTLSLETATAVSPTPLNQSHSATYNAEQWTELPVVPEPSPRVKEIYLKGIELGNHANAFSKVGDCGSTPSWFLGDFDRGARFYNLGDYAYLQSVIEYYQGSFGRSSLAALAGYNTSSVLTPLWSNKEFCANDETPLACEYRVHRPVIALITLGANDVYHLESFEPQLRKIIEYSIEQGVIPVLATKPDNVEKNHFINKTTAQLAIEYQIPLWNYWKAVQDLPNNGLQEDGVHITFAGNDFSNPLNMQAGWPVRNLTALQVLYRLYTFLNTP